MKTITQYFRSIPLSWSRFGCTMLFSLALFVSPYLPLGLVEPQGSRIWLTAAYFYPALVVVWGLWKSHSVIGWSVMGIHGFNIVIFMAIAFLLDRSTQNPAHEVSTWSTYYWQHIALMPFTATGLVYVFSFWGLIAIIFFGGGIADCLRQWQSGRTTGECWATGPDHGLASSGARCCLRVRLLEYFLLACSPFGFP